MGFFFQKQVFQRKPALKRTALFLSLGSLLVFFQNCSPVDVANIESAKLSSLGIQAFITPEDTELNAQLESASSFKTLKSTFEITRQPDHGVMVSLDAESGKFVYKPFKKFIGEDSFSLIERKEGLDAPLELRVSINVTIINPYPVILSDAIDFEMNSTDTPFTLVVEDYNDPSPQAHLSEDVSTTSIRSGKGTLKKIGINKFSYTPDVNFRGLDSFEFTARNSFGYASKKKITLNVGNPFRLVQPSLAVRGLGCATCHLNSDSQVITDFGAGSNFFFGQNAVDSGANPFHAPYSFYGDHEKRSWISASIKNEILVPQVSVTDMKYKLSEYVSGDGGSAKTLADYVRTVANGSKVVEKNKIFIGAPNSVTLMERTRIGNQAQVYLKNQESSPALSGLQNKGAYFEASDLVCDGDLTINGALFVNHLKLKTNDGCRIYATGPIFLLGSIEYSTARSSSTNNANLQLVSSTWINMGVGTGHCESASNPGWYMEWPRNAIDPETNIQSPYYHRMILYGAATREVEDRSQILTKHRQIQKLQESIAGFKDASCEAIISGQSPRDVHFERLLLNAPRIDSRYKGRVSGVIISETVLMSLSSFTFSFDPVFNRVPVLPLLKQSDYLIVQ